MLHYSENASHDWTDDSIRIIVTPSQIARSTFFYVEEVGYFRTQADYFTERKQLNSFLIVITLAGKGYLTYKKKAYTLNVNQAFFINCMDYQFYQTDKNEPWEFLWVHFKGGATQGYYQQFSRYGSPVISLENSDAASTLKKLIKIHKDIDATTELLSSKLLVDLVTEFLLTSTDRQEPNSYIPETMKAIMKYLEKQFTKQISLDHLADHFKISKYHLAREFKKYCAQTPNEYLITCRITYAKDALKYSDQPISTISEEIGIPNVSHFINLFKQRENITPLSYRKKWQRPK